MHPILARWERLVAYLAAWLIVGVLLAAVVTRQGLGWFEALVFLLPLLLIYAFICLSAWYVCRAMPLATSGVPGVLTASAVAAASAGVFWLGLTQAWIAVLRSAAFSASFEAYEQQSPFLFSASVMLFLLVLSVHYVVFAFEAVRIAERQQLELQVLTREAELRALRAQIDPHFLYNSLNSISALTTSDPAGARRMCLLLGDFLRNTLNVSALDRIAIADELALADRFLSIEQVRFGDRLKVERQVDEAATTCRVPPMLLQPLIENAVTHGIAGLLEGGVIHLAIAQRDGRVSIVIENPRDPDSRSARRGGVGLENVRRRLAMSFPGVARMDAAASGDRFRVEIDLPCIAND
jgi:two-component system, LytTR family, sensor histidine kinase AlgZ